MKFTIRTRLLAGFGSIILLAFVSASVTSIRLSRTATMEGTIADDRYPAMLDASLLQSAGASANAALRGYVLFGNDPADGQRFAKERADAWLSLDSATQDLQSRSRNLSSEEQHQVAAIVVQLKSLRGLQDRIEKLAIGHGDENMGKAYDLLKSEAAAQQRDLSSNLQTFVGEERRLTQQDFTALMVSSRGSQFVLWTVAAFAIVAGIGIALYLSKKFADTIGSLLTRATSISAGDLTGDPVAITSKDELGDLTDAINKMQGNLREMIAGLGPVAEHVASASQQLTREAGQTAQGADHQKEQTDQVATAIQEMSATVAEVSENSGKAATQAGEAAQRAAHGGQVVDEVLTRMRGIADSVGATAGKVEELGKNSQQIGKIVEVINDIADQTNLLALNAAIEAARAGEQGRGFAVVADEVRKLAERTTKATTEISQMISAVQQETHKVVADMRNGTHEVERGVEATSKAGVLLKEIITMAERVGSMISQIATSAQQQSLATQQVSTGIEEIAHVAADSARSANQSATASQDLSRVAGDLQGMISRFKLQDEKGGSYETQSQSPRHAAAAAAGLD